MTTLSAPRRLLTAAALAALTSGVALVTTGTSATAGTIKGILPIAVSYVDSATPTLSLPPVEGAVPVGAWQDAAGVRHTSRAFFTYDISGLRGATVMQVIASTGQKAVTDCSAPRQTELRRSAATADAPTWNAQPEELTSLYTRTFRPEGCPVNYTNWDATYGLQKAVREKADRFVLELRVPKALEHDLAQGQWFGSTLHLSTSSNQRPAVPTEVRVDGRDCQGADKPFVTTLTPTLTARVTDPDNDSVGAKFAIWPEDRPDQRTEIVIDTYPSNSVLFATVPAGKLAEGVTYAVALQARDRDGAESAQWSGGCRFTVDLTPPARAPKVSSTDYPETDPGQEFPPGTGGVGITGAFTFDAAGDKDVSRFCYSGNGVNGCVPAEHRGGRAVAQITPIRAGWWNWLDVVSIDRAGNRSPERHYAFTVAETEPSVRDTNPDGGYLAARVFQLGPQGLKDVVEYTYWLEDGAHQTVAAAADHTATVTITPDWFGSRTLHVQSRTAGGLLSPVADRQITVQSAPVVTSEDYPGDGQLGGMNHAPGVFVFRARMPGVTEFVYTFDGVEATVPADSHGTATVEWTPHQGGSHDLLVRSRTADGTESDETYHFFNVNNDFPTVTSDVYPRNGQGGGPGVTGTFTATPLQMNVTGYVYTLDGGPEQTVPVGNGAGTAFTVTPTTGGWHVLLVRSVGQDGNQSDWCYYSFFAGSWS